MVVCECGCGEECRPGKGLIRGHFGRTPAGKAMYAARRLAVPAKNPSGICRCGCGESTPIVSRRRATRGYNVGDHLEFVPGHGQKVRDASHAHGWKGGRYITNAGYVMIYVGRNRYALEHRLVMQRILGRRLARNEHVHHINGIKTDNRPDNLVVLLKLDHHHVHGGESLKRYYADNPEARSTNGRAAANDRAVMSERGKKGAAARWGKRE